MREANDRGFECLLVSDATGSYFPEFKAVTLKMISSQVHNIQTMIECFPGDHCKVLDMTVLEAAMQCSLTILLFLHKNKSCPFVCRVALWVGWHAQMMLQQPCRL